MFLINGSRLHLDYYPSPIPGYRMRRHFTAKLFGMLVLHHINCTEDTRRDCITGILRCLKYNTYKYTD